jgi:hypothetical protein
MSAGDHARDRSIRHSPRSGARAVALTLGCLAQQAHAAELLPNGDFSAAAGIAGWDSPLSPEPPSPFLWSADDALNAPDSGSLEFDVFAQSDQIVQSECFRILPNAVYAFGGKGRRISGAATTWFTCTLFSDPSCATGTTDWGSTELATGPDWASGFVINGALPPSANSMHCRLWVDNSGNADASVVRVDALYFDSDDQLFVNGFDPPPM